jgi:hypothetical protein
VPFAPERLAQTSPPSTFTVTVHQVGAGWAWSSLVPVLALLFTVASFWWLYARRGRVVSTSVPHGYALSATDALFLLRIPVTVRNTGARSIVVRNMRMWIEDIPHALELPWRRTMKHLQPWGDDLEGVSAPFVVPGRESHVVIAEFGSPLPGFKLTPGTHTVLVEIDDDGHGRRTGDWRELLRFEWHVPGPPADWSKYTLHYNKRDDEHAQRRAADELRDFMDRLQIGSEPDDREGS